MTYSSLRYQVVEAWHAVVLASTTAGKHHNARCATAAARTEKLEQRRVALEARIDKAQKAHAKAVAGHHD